MGHVTNPYDASKPADVGNFLVAIKPDLFLSIDKFKERMDYLYQRVVGYEKIKGLDRIYYPGEIEDINQEKRLVDGIPFTESEIASLNREAKAVGISTLKQHS